MSRTRERKFKSVGSKSNTKRFRFRNVNQKKNTHTKSTSENIPANLKVKQKTEVKAQQNGKLTVAKKRLEHIKKRERAYGWA